MTDTSAANPYAWWQAAVAGLAPAIDADTPHPGFYKKRAFKNGPWVPVYIAPAPDGELLARIGNDPTPHKAADIWTWVSGNPVSKDDAQYAFKNGHFPGEHVDGPTAANGQSIKAAREAGLGDNSGGVGLPELIRDAIEQWSGWRAKNKVTDRISADLAANYAGKLRALASRAEKERDEKIRPHLEAQREINAAYKPAIDAAKATAKDVDTTVDVWVETEKERRRREVEEKARREAELARRRAAEEAAAAEAARRAAIEEAEAQGNHELVTAIELESHLEVSLPPEPEVIIAPEPERVLVGGQYGSRYGGARKKPATWVVTDWDAAVRHFAHHEKVHEVIEKLATAAAKAGVELSFVRKVEG